MFSDFFLHAYVLCIIILTKISEIVRNFTPVRFSFFFETPRLRFRKIEKLKVLEILNSERSVWVRGAGF